MSQREDMERIIDGGQIADAMILCLTRGMSLWAWERAGVLEREWAIHERLARHYGKIIVVSYGDHEGEKDLAKARGVELIQRPAGTTPERYSTDLPAMVRERTTALRVRSAAIVTNQFEGGAEAVAITRALRDSGVKASLIARGGYLWSRFEAWKHGPESDHAARAAAEEGDLCRCADMVIGTTNSMIDDIAWRYAIERRRLRVVPNYILNGDPLPNVGIEASDTPVILSAGRLDKQKRFDFLIHAVAISGVKDRVTLRIVGEGPLRDDLRKQAQREGVSLELASNMPHAALLAEMRACRLYVQCSAYEGHPKTVLEAMGAGACVVVTNAPGLREVVRDDETGVISDMDERALGDHIREVLVDDTKRRRIGRMARMHARNHYDIDGIEQKMLAAHQIAVMRAPPPSARATMSGVRWDPLLLRAPRQQQIESWHTSLAGFARRLAPGDRAAFLLSLDDPIYQLQGPAAIEFEQQTAAGSGIHPKHRLMRYHDFFVDRINAGERVIDLGSGIGALAASIAERASAGAGATVVGVEIEPRNLAKAQTIAHNSGLSARLHYVQGDITTHRATNSGGGASFDAVVLSNVLEHIKNRPAMLRQWAQWYSPKRFLIRVPAFDRDWKVPFKKELGVEWRLDDTHELEYTAQTLEAELREAGLEITECVTRWGEYWVSARPVPSREAWAAVRMLVFDFDGVMSNNQVLVMQDGTEGVLCNRSDGMGVEMLRKAAAARTPALDPAFSMLVLSKEVNPVVAARCRKLKLECHQGVDDKLPALKRLAAERGVAREQVAYVGNDINDVECMAWAHLPIAVNDAFPACKAAARVVTVAPGGHGAVREVCEKIIDAWNST